MTARAILQGLEGRDALKRAEATRALQNLSADEQVELAEAEAHEFNRAKLATIQEIMLAAVVVVTLEVMMHSLTWVGGGLISIVLGLTALTVSAVSIIRVPVALLTHRAYSAVSVALSLSSDPRLIKPSLALAVQHIYVKERNLLLAGLKQMLPNSSTSARIELSKLEARSLTRVLIEPYEDTVLTLMVLRSVAQLSETRAMPAVRKPAQIQLLGQSRR